MQVRLGMNIIQFNAPCFFMKVARRGGEGMVEVEENAAPCNFQMPSFEDEETRSKKRKGGMGKGEMGRGGGSGGIQFRGRSNNESIRLLKGKVAKPESGERKRKKAKRGAEKKRND